MMANYILLVGAFVLCAVQVNLCHGTYTYNYDSTANWRTNLQNFNSVRFDSMKDDHQADILKYANGKNTTEAESCKADALTKLTNLTEYSKKEIERCTEGEETIATYECIKRARTYHIDQSNEITAQAEQCIDKA